MPVPVDPYPDFRNGIDVADGDQVDARFKALYDALNPAAVGIGHDNMIPGGIVLADLAAAVLNNFLKLGVAADIKAVFGRQDVGAWDANSKTFAFTHNLGRPPLLVLLTTDYCPGANNSTGQDQGAAVSYGGGNNNGGNVRVTVGAGAVPDGVVHCTLNYLVLG